MAMGQWVDEVVTAPEAARLKGVAESSIRRAIQDGRLAGLRRGHVYLVRRADLDAWQPVGHRPRRSAAGSGQRPAAGQAFPGREAPGDAASQGPLPSGASLGQTSSDRAARIKALQDEFADLSISTEEFLREKHDDLKWEEQREVTSREMHAGRQRNACADQA